ncbi:MAG: metallophosphoesterase [Pseudomonadales bacterium]
MKSLFPYLLLILLCHPFAAQSSDSPDSFSGVARIVAIGDVHGAHDAVLKLLRGNGLIDESDRWIGGDTHLVSLGDLLDRGRAVRPVLDLFMALQPQAEAAGGRVHVLLGNHELMNLMGDWRDVAPADLQSFAEGDQATALAQRQQMLAPSGRYGRWLLEQPILVRVNDTLFTHGGLPGLLLERTLSEHNEVARRDLRSALEQAQALAEASVIPAHSNLFELAEQAAQPEEDPKLTALRELGQSAYWQDEGPLWYRGSSLCHGLVEADLTSSVLQHLNATSVVVGHSPTWNHQIRRRMAGRVWVADTGMLHAVYRGQPLALEIRGDERQVRDANGQPLAFDDEQFAAYSEADIRNEQAMLTSAKYTLATQPPEENGNGRAKLIDLSGESGAQTGQAWFWPMRKRNAGREEAAYMLDRLLGIGMVPTTIVTTFEGKNGVLQLLQPRVITEQVRLDRGLGFPNWCERGNNYQVVTAFDALVNQRKRSVDNLAYSHRMTRIQLTEHGDAFGTAKQLPPTSVQPALSMTLRGRLQALSQAQLEQRFGESLNKREVSALLKRRDAMLKWPALGGP